MVSDDLAECVGRCDKSDFDFRTDCEHVALPQGCQGVADSQGRGVGHVDLDIVDGAIDSLCPVTGEAQDILCVRITSLVDCFAIGYGIPQHSGDSSLGYRVNEQRALIVVNSAEHLSLALGRDSEAVADAAGGSDASVRGHQRAVKAVACAGNAVSGNVCQGIEIRSRSSAVENSSIELLSQSQRQTRYQGIIQTGHVPAELIREGNDDGQLVECRGDSGQSMVTGFIRIAGMTLGVVACNEFEGQKRLSAAGCDKAAKLIDLCTRFHIPLLTITDTDGYKTDSATEAFLPSAADRMVRALTASDVPKLNLVTGSIVGSAYSMLNSKGLGADYVFMWDSANVSIVEPRQATEVIFGEWSSGLEQQYRDTQSSAVALARHGFADKVISPEDSRKYIIGALQTFVNSR